MIGIYEKRKKSGDYTLKLDLNIVPNSETQSKIMTLGSNPLGPGVTRMLVSKGMSSGGTFAIGVLALRYMLAKPGCTVLLVRRTRISIKESTMGVWLKHVIPLELVESYSSITGNLVLKNGSKVIAVGTSSNVDDLRSMECCLALCDESHQLSEDNIDIVLSRIREHHPCGNALVLITNPVSNYHWLYKWSRDPDVIFLKDKSENNKHTPKGYVDMLKQRYLPIDGEFTVNEDLVFTGYHYIDPEQFPTHTPIARIIGLDAGGGGSSGKSQACILLSSIYRDPKTNNQVYTIDRELLVPASTHSDIISNIELIWRGTGETGNPVIASDPANAFLNRALEQRGCKLLDVRKNPGSVLSGEQQVNSMLSDESLMVRSNCYKTLAALSMYDGTDSGFKDVPDTIRYIVMSTLNLSRGIWL